MARKKMCARFGGSSRHLSQMQKRRRKSSHFFVGGGSFNEVVATPLANVVAT